MRRIAFRFVAFVAVTGVLTTWIALQITGAEFGDRYRLTASFDDVSGLRAGDAVKLAGVEVGEVAHVEVDRGRAVVDFDVDESVAVPADSTIEVRWRNLIGQRYLSVVPGESGTALGDGDVVEATADLIEADHLGPQLSEGHAAERRGDEGRALDHAEAVEGARSRHATTAARRQSRTASVPSSRSASTRERRWARVTAPTSSSPSSSTSLRSVSPSKTGPR